GAIATTDGTAARPAVRLDPGRAPGGARPVSEVVTITGIATGGDGVGRLADGRAVFVPRAAPGERIRLRDGVRLHKHFAKAELAKIVAAGAERVAAPCPHYVHDRCGGCQLQHRSEERRVGKEGRSGGGRGRSETNDGDGGGGGGLGECGRPGRI